MQAITTTNPNIGSTIVDTYPIRRTFVLTSTTIGHNGRSITYHGGNGETLLTRKGEEVAVLR